MAVSGGGLLGVFIYSYVPLFGGGGGGGMVVIMVIVFVIVVVRDASRGIISVAG